MKTVERNGIITEVFSSSIKKKDDNSDTAVVIFVVILVILEFQRNTRTLVNSDRKECCTFVRVSKDKS